MPIPRRLVSLVAATLLIFSLPLVGQTEPQHPPHRIGVRVDLVNVEVTVTDARGKPIGNLRRENFRVLDDGVEQRVTHFASIETPAQVLLLVETSPAVYLLHRQHLQAAFALLGGLAANDRIAVATYDQTAGLLVNFTEDKRALAQALDGLRYNLGMAELRLYQSLATLLDWLTVLPGKKAIVLLSTGLDSSGATRWEELLGKLRSSEVVLLPVALGGELRETPSRKCGKQKSGVVEPASAQPGLSFAEADRALEAMAQATGGRAYFPRDARDFAGIYREIATRLRHQYSLGFPPTVRDGRLHKLEVQVVDATGRVLSSPADSGGYRIHSRQTYLAPRP